MKTVCETNQCVGCMACIDTCSCGAISIMDSLSAYNAVIDEEKCVSCGRCYKACQKNMPLELKKPIMWKQGHAANEEIRRVSSSGGLASAIERAFVANGGVVYSCTFADGEFFFDVAETEDEVNKFVGSKYVKSNPTGVYTSVREGLKSGKKVLFVGLPCQVAALKKRIPAQMQEKLFTIDLICHGTPSPQVLEIFLNNYGCSLKDLKDIQFRIKQRFQIEKDGRPLLHYGVCDRYMIAFLNCLFYTENCYSCDYARFERVSDVTLGDSWGSDLPEHERKKGVSLALCQSEKGKVLLDMAQLELFEVDISSAIANNQQLEAPSKIPKGKDAFFKKIKEGRNFNRLVTKLYLKQSLKQDIKWLLYQARLLRGKDME